MFNSPFDAAPSDVFRSIAECNCDEVAAILIKDPGSACVLGSDGRSPLMVAAGMSNLDLVKTLVGVGGADPNQLSYVRGDTALFFAVEARSLPVVFYLIYVGGRLLKNRNGSTPLDWARTNLPPNDRLRLILEQFQSTGLEAFGLSARHILAPPSCNKFIGQPEEEALLRGLQGFSVVDETEADVVISGFLPFVFHGGEQSAPVVTYISKAAIAGIFDNCSLRSSDEEIGRRNPASLKHLTEARDAKFRCIIDMSRANGLVLSPNASYLDPITGIVMASIIETNACISVTEFLATVVAELFQTTPPLVQQQPQHVDPLFAEPPLAKEAPITRATSLPRPALGIYLRAIALTCSKFHNGDALRTVPKNRSIVGVIPIKYRPQMEEGALSALSVSAGVEAPSVTLRSLGVSDGVLDPHYDPQSELFDLRASSAAGVGLAIPVYSKEEAISLLRDLEGKGPQTRFRVSRFPGYNFSIPVRIELGVTSGSDEPPPPVVKVVATPESFFVPTPTCTVLEGGLEGVLTLTITKSKESWSGEYASDPLGVFSRLLEEVSAVLSRDPPLRIDLGEESYNGDAKPTDGASPVKKKKKKGFFSKLFK